MGSSRLGVHIEGDRVNVGFVTVYDMIRVAYRAKSYQLVDESFLQTDRWEIQAKLPDGASKDQVADPIR